MISLKDYLTASGSYPDRENHKELTDQIKQDGQKLLDKVNKLLKHLGMDNAKTSSGFRPSEVNSATPNAAKRSLHMTGHAIDILDDKDQTLAKRIQSEEEKAQGFLKSFDLWLEHPDSTKGQHTNWCHLDDSSTRPDRKIRIFKP